MNSTCVKTQSESDVELVTLAEKSLRAQVLYPTDGDVAHGEWKLETIDVLQDPNLPKTCYIFVNKAEKEYYLKEVETLVVNHFRTIPQILFTEHYKNLNGFSGCRPEYGADDVLQTYSTWFRCYVKVLDDSMDSDTTVPEYTWYEMTFFTRWDSSGDCRVLCIDTPEDLARDLQNSLVSKTRNSPDLNTTDPFFLHIPVIDQVLLQYTNSVWRVRNPIRSIEKHRMTSLVDILTMQEVSRHAIHVGEVLGVTEKVLEKMTLWQVAVYHYAEKKLSRSYVEQMKEYTRFQLHVVQALIGRSDSNLSRLQNEITLSHNLIAQQDNKIALQDNKVMKTIAFLGMIFLPATFFSALFSTTFFNFDESELHVSKSFWIYWVVTVPSTIIVMICWRYWLRRREDFTIWADREKAKSIHHQV